MTCNLEYYNHVVRVQGPVVAILAAIHAKNITTPILFQITDPDIKYPFFIRVPSSDISVCGQIFIGHDYAFNITRQPKTIVDAGANIGIASIYFSNTFPSSRIIAIEPEKSNFEILKRNVGPYENIIPVCGALWHENRMIHLVDPGLGKWGFMTHENDGDNKNYGDLCHEISGITVDMIMKEYGIDHIDILKMDIEGAEREVFRNASAWIEKVDVLIVELHERMKSGCNRSFYNGTNGFDDEWIQGENVYLARNSSCLTRGERRTAGPLHNLNPEIA